jgi:hypothetical protein
MQDPIPQKLASRPEVWAEIVAACEARGITGQDAEDVAFHMTDWMDDFHWLQRFFADPRGSSAEAVGQQLHSILSHVPHHIAAAKILYTGSPVIDVFGVGAVREESHDEPGSQ